MHWTEWWFVVSFVVFITGLVPMAKAYYDYFRDESRGLSPGLMLLGGFLGGIGLVSLLVRLIYVLLAN